MLARLEMFSQFWGVGQTVATISTSTHAATDAQSAVRRRPGLGFEFATFAWSKFR
jgi:hypothetical protein